MLVKGSVLVLMTNLINKPMKKIYAKKILSEEVEQKDESVEVLKSNQDDKINDVNKKETNENASKEEVKTDSRTNEDNSKKDLESDETKPSNEQINRNGNTRFKEIFNKEFNESLVHQVTTDYLSNHRSSYKSTKNRSAVSGGGAKPRPQKVLGEQELGLRRLIWRGGGLRLHQPKNYNKNKQENV